MSLVKASQYYIAGAAFSRDSTIRELEHALSIHDFDRYIDVRKWAACRDSAIVPRQLTCVYEEISMTFKELVELWASSTHVKKTDEDYSVRLPVDAAARLHALADIYDGRTIEEIITDLLAVSLDEVETALPYVAGDKVIREDEFGDPIYEDAGPTPKFEKLRRAHLKRLGGKD